MLNLIFALIILSSTNYAVPGSSLHLYLTDNDLNTSRNGIDTIQTTGLLEFSINGIPITGSAAMKETAVNSGVFAFDVNIPTTINGKSLGSGDVLLIKYHDQTDAAGEPNTITKSISLSKTLSQLSTSTKSVRIGERFLLQLYEPDRNLDSKNPDTISLNQIEFRAKGIRTTLANSAFDTSTPGLRETGYNTNLFTTNLEIPRHIDGKTIKIGSIVEFRFIDTSSASSTSETLKTKLRVGYSK
ncbi:MAG TPA: hypothetical protein VLB45_05840 [Nitrosopumilaceae archaeon]|nr:hypothetical protein [Nitrosopumilaceae archaeon]